MKSEIVRGSLYITAVISLLALGLFYFFKDRDTILTIEMLLCLLTIEFNSIAVLIVAVKVFNNDVESKD